MYTDLWTLTKSNQKKPFTSCYHLIYLSLCCTSGNSSEAQTPSTRSPVAVAVQLGSAEDVSPKAQRRTACSSRRANHTVFTLQRLGPVEFPFNILQHPSTNSGHLKMNCGVVFYCIALN